MKSSKLIEMYSDGNIVIPIYILKNYKKLNINLDEFVFLMYLYSKGNNIIFDPAKFSSELNMDLGNVMEFISNLSDKNLVKVDVIKNDKKVLEEVIKLDDFYSKLSFVTIEEVNSSNVSDNKNVFEMVEKEFGRTLSPMEYEIIKAWTESGISEELIEEALREAVFNGVSNLRYIDKILYEWGKKGIKTREDVIKNKDNFKKQSKKELDTKDIDLDIMEWNWFDEDE